MLNSELNMGDHQSAQCPVCRVPSPQLSVIAGWGHWHRCPICTLEFADPMRLPSSPESLFGDAYLGRGTINEVADFRNRIRIRNAIVGEPNLWFWTPAFKLTIEWVKKRLSQGEAVLEIGCGLGLLMHEFRRHGVRVCGVDAAESAVDLNRKDGFQVWHGNADAVPADFGNFRAIVSMFMLHHLVNPLEFLSGVREKWPEAGFVISQYGPTNVDPARSVPPRTLTKWNKLSLGTALTAAGYTVEMLEVPSTGAEARPFTRVQTSKSVQEAVNKITVPRWVFRTNMRIENVILPRILHRLQKEAFVLVAFATPRSEAVPHRGTSGSKSSGA